MSNSYTCKLLILLTAGGCIFVLLFSSLNRSKPFSLAGNDSIYHTVIKPLIAGRVNDILSERITYKHHCTKHQGLDCCRGLQHHANYSQIAETSNLFCITFSQQERSFYLTSLTKREEHLSFYVGMAIIFLKDLFNHPNLLFSSGGEALWIISDDGTMSADLIEMLSEMKIPLLTHVIRQQHRSVSVLVPNFHYIQHKGYHNLIQTLRSNTVQFEEKEKVVFWRGSDTGYGSCEALPRVVLAKKSIQLPWLDIKLTKLLQKCSGAEAQLTTEGIYLDYKTPEINWVEHRGILDIDGNADAWGLGE